MSVRYDEQTGKPIYPVGTRFDPNTGAPILPQAKPVNVDYEKRSPSDSHQMAKGSIHTFDQMLDHLANIEDARGTWTSVNPPVHTGEVEPAETEIGELEDARNE